MSQAVGEERPWLARYPEGTPADIDPSSLRTLVDLFEASVAHHASMPAFESFGARLTYGQIGEQARAVASALQRMGLKKGDRVAVMMPNVMAYPAILFGVLSGGFTLVNVNPLYTPRELVHLLNDSGARIIFILENFAHTLATTVPELETVERAIIVKPGDLLGMKGALVNFVSRYVKRMVKPHFMPGMIRLTRLLSWGRRRMPQPAGVEPTDVAFLQYTGGTTGAPKAAVLTHGAVAANVLQAEAWLKPSLDQRVSHVMFTALPLYHILALTACCLFMFRIGAMQVLIANPRDLKGLVDTMKATPPTMLVMVNTLYNALSRFPSVKDVDFSRLSLCIAGGMATQASVARRWKELTGKPIIEGYGLSETSPLVSVNRLDIEEFTGTIGYPVSSTHVRVAGPQGEPLPPGEPGELWVKGPQVMSGYWRQPEETARAMTPDGWLRTGDVAVMEADGALRIVDRIKDMIVVSGFKVFPNEVEEVLAAHPKVEEAAVVGRPVAQSGEMVVAYVSARDPSLTAEELRAYAREQLAPYKNPRHYEFRESLPKSTVGKILRRELREEAAAAPERA